MVEETTETQLCFCSKNSITNGSIANSRCMDEGFQRLLAGGCENNIQEMLKYLPFVMSIYLYISFLEGVILKQYINNSSDH